MILRLFFAYLFGSIPCEFILRALKKRAVFSTSASHKSTTLRNLLGEDWTILLHFLNFLKGFLPVILFAASSYSANEKGETWYLGYFLIAAAVSVGHLFPVWTRSKRDGAILPIVIAVGTALLFPLCAVVSALHHSPHLNQYSSAFRVFLLSYICGSFPSGYLIGRINGIDIRRYGSHNIGSTNVRRTLGKDWGVVCFIFDFSKGLLPVMLIGQAHCGALSPVWGGLLAAAAAVVGHIFPVWLKFRGGKGVATSLGVVMGIAFWPVLVAGIFWLVSFLRTRIVAIASMLAVAALAVSALIMHLCYPTYLSWPEILFFTLIALGVIACHHENIHRLLQGKENAFQKPDSTPKA